jgi:glycosyltransferase involved in cell wall biosynthesis
MRVLVTQKMKTSSLHINDQSTWRGGEQQVYYLLKGLKERGQRAELVAQPTSVLGERAREIGVKVHPIRMRGEADLPSAVRIARLVARERFDVVHMHTAHAHALGCLACAFNPAPLCIVSRRVDFPINKMPFGIPSVKYRWRVDHYVAISEAVKKVLAAGGVRESKVSVVHSGVEPRTNLPPRAEIRRSLGFPEGANIVGSVGALVDHKGQRFLIEAAPLILRKAPSTKFVFVGNGELRASLKTLASELNVDDAIMFTGYQSNAHEYISAFDVFVAPSLMEGLNTSILDAMMLARPVVGTTAGGIPEIIEHEKTGLLVPPRNARALAEAILDLLSNPDKSKRLALAGHSRAVAEFTADQMVEGTIAVYGSLLKDPCKT